MITGNEKGLPVIFRWRYNSEASRVMGRRNGKPILMISSSVYGHESLLDQMYAILSRFGYTVWMSHRGTLPTDSRYTAFENCLRAVDSCDLFLGVITGRYGSGKPKDGSESIVHQEMRRAIALKKPRWFLVQYEVTVARELLKQFRYDAQGEQIPFTLRRNAVLDDVRVLDMYEEAIRQNTPLPERLGNWAQSYRTQSEALEILRAQFSNRNRIQKIVAETSIPEKAEERA